MTLAQAKGLPNLFSHSLKAIPSLGLPLHHSCQVSPAKKGSSVTVDCTNEHSTTSGTPLSPFKQASANIAPA
ncbi:hypothetical protein HanRHA438_Chr10g0462991 [Helianthus annuus]|nr:hypothetical protein HanRHA438_Chr10g0462991 [Helianthus annuus]